jgi:hypothetical protein
MAVERLLQGLGRTALKTSDRAISVWASLRTRMAEDNLLVARFNDIFLVFFSLISTFFKDVLHEMPFFRRPHLTRLIIFLVSLETYIAVVFLLLELRCKHPSHCLVKISSCYNVTVKRCLLESVLVVYFQVQSGILACLRSAVYFFFLSYNVCRDKRVTASDYIIISWIVAEIVVNRAFESFRQRYLRGISLTNNPANNIYPQLESIVGVVMFFENLRCYGPGLMKGLGHVFPGATTIIILLDSLLIPMKFITLLVLRLKDGYIDDETKILFQRFIICSIVTQIYQLSFPSSSVYSQCAVVLLVLPFFKKTNDYLNGFLARRAQKKPPHVQLSSKWFLCTILQHEVNRLQPPDELLQKYRPVLRLCPDANSRPDNGDTSQSEIPESHPENDPNNQAMSGDLTTEEEWNILIQNYLHHCTILHPDLDILPVYLEWTLERKFNPLQVASILEILRKSATTTITKVIYFQALYKVTIALIQMHYRESDNARRKGKSSEHKKWLEISSIKEKLNLNYPVAYKSSLDWLSVSMVDYCKANKAMISEISKNWVSQKKLEGICKKMLHLSYKCVDKFNFFEGFAREFDISHLYLLYVFSELIVRTSIEPRSLVKRMGHVLKRIASIGINSREQLDNTSLAVEGVVLKVSLNKENFGMVVSCNGRVDLISKDYGKLKDFSHTKLLPKIYQDIHSNDNIWQAYSSGDSGLTSNRRILSYFVNQDTGLITGCVLTKRILALITNEDLYCCVGIRPVSSTLYQTMLVDADSLHVMEYSSSFLDIIDRPYLIPGENISAYSRAISERIARINSLKSGSTLLEPDEDYFEKVRQQAGVLTLDEEEEALQQRSPGEKPVYYRFDDVLLFKKPNSRNPPRQLKFRVEISRRRARFIDKKKHFYIIRLRLIEDLSLESKSSGKRYMEQRSQYVNDMRKNIKITVSGDPTTPVSLPGTISGLDPVNKTSLHDDSLGPRYSVQRNDVKRTSLQVQEDQLSPQWTQRKFSNFSEGNTSLRSSSFIQSSDKDDTISGKSFTNFFDNSSEFVIEENAFGDFNEADRGSRASQSIKWATIFSSRPLKRYFNYWLTAIVFITIYSRIYSFGVQYLFDFPKYRAVNNLAGSLKLYLMELKYIEYNLVWRLAFNRGFIKQDKQESSILVNSALLYCSEGNLYGPNAVSINESISYLYSFHKYIDTGLGEVYTRTPSIYAEVQRNITAIQQTGGNTSSPIVLNFESHCMISLLSQLRSISLDELYLSQRSYPFNYLYILMPNYLIPALEDTISMVGRYTDIKAMSVFLMMTLGALFNFTGSFGYVLVLLLGKRAKDRCFVDLKDIQTGDLRMREQELEIFEARITQLRESPPTTLGAQLQIPRVSSLRELNEGLGRRLKQSKSIKLNSWSLFLIHIWLAGVVCIMRIFLEYNKYNGRLILVSQYEKVREVSETFMKLTSNYISAHTAALRDEIYTAREKGLVTSFNPNKAITQARASTGIEQLTSLGDPSFIDVTEARSRLQMLQEIIRASPCKVYGNTSSICDPCMVDSGFGISLMKILQRINELSDTFFSAYLIEGSNKTELLGQKRLLDFVWMFNTVYYPMIRNVSEELFLLGKDVIEAGTIVSVMDLVKLATGTYIALSFYITFGAVTAYFYLRYLKVLE